jgi:deoxynucleoside triphosphate triphosphohydrolase SAMHD1
MNHEVLYCPALTLFPVSFLARAIEYMLVDALLSAEPHMHIAEQVHIPEKYIHLCDNIVQRIEMSEDPVRLKNFTISLRRSDFSVLTQELQQARAILARVTTRDLYKCVDFKALHWDYLEKLREYCTPESVVLAAKTYQPKTEIERKLIEELDPKHVIVDEAILHYGMGKDNPLDKVKFYSKHHPNGMCLVTFLLLSFDVRSFI